MQELFLDIAIRFSTLLMIVSVSGVGAMGLIILIETTYKEKNPPETNILYSKKSFWDAFKMLILPGWSLKYIIVNWAGIFENMIAHGLWRFAYPLFQVFSDADKRAYFVLKGAHGLDHEDNLPTMMMYQDKLDTFRIHLSIKHGSAEHAVTDIHSRGRTAQETASRWNDECDRTCFSYWERFCLWCTVSIHSPRVYN